MATLINKDKQISKQRQEFVEHNFEAMIGARKRRYNDTQAQKQRTEFFEDYYLLYTRNKYKLDQQKAMWNELKEWAKDLLKGCDLILDRQQINNDLYNRTISQKRIIINMLSKMQELEKGGNNEN